MTIGGIDPTTTGAASTASATGTSTASQLSNPQLFLQLLIAELQNQDPTNPTDPSTILQQTSELSQVEAVQQMTTALNQQETATQTSEATGLIGKQITATVQGNTVSGTVADVQLDGSGSPMLDLGSTLVPLSDVTQINS